MALVTRAVKGTPLTATDHDNNLRYAVLGHAAVSGAIGNGVADDATGLALAISSGDKVCHLSGIYLTGTTLVLTNDLAIQGGPQALTSKDRIHATGNIPIFYRATGYQSRLVIDDIMLHGDKTGDYAATGNMNTAPLVWIVQGGAYFNMTRTAIFRTVVGVRIDAGFNLMTFRDVRVNGVTDKAYHLVGARHCLFDGCSFENSAYGVYAVPSFAATGVGDSTGAQKVTIRNCYTETANFWLDVAAPEVRGCFFHVTVLTIGKNAVYPTIKGNSTITACYLILPPKFGQDVEYYAVNCVNTKTQGNFPIPALPPVSDISGATGYVAGDGLDYFVATQLKPNTTYTAQTATVEFRVDAAVISKDTGQVVTSDGTADNNAGRLDLAMTTYGVLSNTGAAMSATVTAGTVTQKTVFIQSLIKNGTFPAGSTTNWFSSGTPTISHDGTYLRVQSATNSNLLNYNRLIHYPRDTETLLVIARVKSGSTGTISNGSLTTGKFANFFDNGDGTFDDLWMQYTYVKGDRTLAKATIAIYREVGFTGYDVYVRWVAAVPLVKDGDAKIYEGTWTFDPASIAADGTATTTIMSDGSTTNDMKNVNVGDRVQVFAPYDLSTVRAEAYVSATGQITVRLTNPGTAAVDLVSGTWRWELIKA